MATITLRAASPDNDVYVTQLIDLFKSQFGDAYPARSVYSPQFWKSHMALRFASVLVFLDQKLVGHFGLRRDARAPSVVELTHVVFHSALDEREDSLEIASTLSKALDEKLSRMNARVLYEVAFEDISDKTTIHSIFAKLSTVAYLPAPRATLILRQRLLGGVHSAAHTFHAPEEHEQLVSGEYRRLLNGYAALSASGFGAERGSLVSADLPGVEKLYFPFSQVYYLFVQPSLTDNYGRTGLLSGLRPGAEAAVFINLEDSACPEFCSWIESQDFRFSGMMFGARGRNSVIYSRESAWCSDILKSEAAPQVNPVLHYLKNYLSNSVTEASVPEGIAQHFGASSR